MTADTGKQSAWRGRAAVWLLGAVFVVSAGAKLAGLGAFERYLVEQGLTGDLSTAGVLARLVIGVELFLGLALFQRAWLRRVVLPATTALLVVFSGYLVYTGLVKGETGSCHCLGELVAMSPVESLLKNGVLLVLCGLGFRWTKGWTSTRWWVPTTMAVVTAGLVFGGFRGQVETPQPGEPSRFAVFTQFESDGQPVQVSLTAGTCVVAFFSLDCDHCKAVARQLAEARGELPPVYMVCLGSEAEALDFQFETGAIFPYRLVEPEVFFKFIGVKPPRVFLLKDGLERGQWDEPEFSVDAVRAAEAQ